MSLRPGTAGYSAEASKLAVQYESITFAEVHAGILPLLPAPPARAIDIGAGTGRDAGALAAMGYRVTAVEPTAEMRAEGRRLHPAGIEWVDDGLPDLSVMCGRGEQFDLVMMTAVWMHLDEGERARAMPAVCALLAPGALLTMSLRHGPVPAGRRMFDVSAEETIALAAPFGLVSVHRSARPSVAGRDILGRDGVTWTVLAFRSKPSADS